MLVEYIHFAAQTFIHRPTRSWLTVLGILIGIAAVVSLISIGQGLQDTINKQFERLGADKIIVIPGSMEMGLLSSAFGTERLTDDDVRVVEETKGVQKATGMVAVMGKVRADNKQKYVFVIAYPPDRMSLDEWGAIDLEDGRELKPTDKYKVVIGYLIAQGEVFDKKIGIGDSLYINDVKFEVVGTVSRIGNRADDSQVYIPVETANELFKEPGYYTIIAQTKKGFDTTTVADWVKERLRKARHLEKGREDFTIQTMEQMQEMVGNVMGVVQLIVIGIAAISLIVGGIGIMNTMYTSILERTREIGILKAIGARSSDIAAIFLLESGFLGLVGGVIGVALGIAGGKAVEMIAQQSTLSLTVSFPSWLLLGALVFAFVVGALSGLLPALKAAGMKPIEALRYE
ncbi:MAG: ABC transporter permease [Candidatus Micrarchaeia archaeon]